MFDIVRSTARTPALAIIVVIFNMEREAKNTLYSLCARYQRGVEEKDYEVIVVDNGSTKPFPTDFISTLGRNFRHYYIENAKPSPASAINFGVRKSNSKYIGIMIDGARIVSPGMIKYVLQAFRGFQNAIVTVLGWHIGPDITRRAVEMYGYNKDAEEKLLADIEWPKDGYRLFDISTLGGSSQDGWFLPKSESSSLFMSRDNFDYLGGYDEQFDAPGGGLVNIDTYVRACEIPNTELVIILGEGTFHQMHDGAMTGASEEEAKKRYIQWTAQYERIRGRSPTKPSKEAMYIGHVPRQTLSTMLRSAQNAIEER